LHGWQAFATTSWQIAFAPSQVYTHHHQKKHCFLQAYKKLANDMAQHSGIPALPKLLKSPITKKIVAVAVYDQLVSNLILPNAALMGNATNGTVYTTSHDVKLTLLVK
jgi:hypothetical protein